ncbi:MAG: AAA family ATPase, partial [Chloroflexota bacterium]
MSSDPHNPNTPPIQADIKQDVKTVTGGAVIGVLQGDYYAAPSPPTAHFPIFRVARPPNPHFTGRDALLAQLHDALTTTHTPTTLTQTISGLGGVGKTQLAAEYAHRHAAEYDVVWWVRADDPATLASDYAQLAQPLQLPERDAPDQRLVVAAVRDWLQQHDRWLLVCDNVTDPALLADYLLQRKGGHTLIT